MTEAGGPGVREAAPPLNLDGFEELARERLPEAVYHYFAGGAADELTLRENRAAFERIQLLPRVLRGGERRTATTVLGAEVAFPALIAPLAYQKVAHTDGELATAAAAAATGAGMCVSSLANHALPEIAREAGSAPLFFQLYPYRDRGMTEEVVRQAQEAGYRALLVTVDVPVHGRRERELRHPVSLPEDCPLPCVPLPPGDDGPVTPRLVSSLMQPDLSWDDIERLQAITDLPVVLKGVLSPKDASIAAEIGAAGVVVSNHGGRQLDTVPAAVDALPAVVDVAADKLEVLVDGGVRRGTDVVKALALGASAVLVGRPIVWALAAGGERGVRMALELLAAEVADALALCGCKDLRAVSPELIA